MTAFGNLTYLWGNMPAFDVLNIQKNEGRSYAKDIDMLFAGEYLMEDSNASAIVGWMLTYFLPQRRAIFVTSSAPSTDCRVLTRRPVPLLSMTRTTMS